MGDRPRKARIERRTRETRIALSIALDGGVGGSIRTSVPFLDHMLTLASAHGGLGLSVRATGDIAVDDHHLVEDVGICLGQALLKALGDKRGIRRYADVTVPMDEALVSAAIDISGRPFLAQSLAIGGKIKTFDTALVREFFLGFTRNAKCTLHVRQHGGDNIHHIIEAAFKAFGRAVGDAVVRDSRFKGVPSTKGSL